MIFDDVGVTFANKRTQIGDQASFVGWVWRLKGGSQALCIAHSYHKDAPALGAQGGRFEVELEPAEIAICEIAIINPPRYHQVLLDWPDPVVPILYIVEAFDRLAQPLACAGDNRPLQRTSITCRNQVAIGIGWAVEPTMARTRPLRARRRP